MDDDLRRDTDDVRCEANDIRDDITTLESMLETLRHSGDARVIETIEESLRARVEGMKRAMND